MPKGSLTLGETIEVGHLEDCLRSQPPWDGKRSLQGGVYGFSLAIDQFPIGCDSIFLS
jgi:hypothetical protein